MIAGVSLLLAPPASSKCGGVIFFRVKCGACAEFAKINCRFALGSFDRYDDAMLWRSSAPVRHPPGFIAPCLPTNGRAVPTGPQWVYEIKHDGFRFVCRREGDWVRVFSRRGIDHSDRAPAIVEALMALNIRSVTIDGEGVVCGPDGVTDFDRLRAAMGRKGSRQAFLYAFDLLELDGKVPSPGAVGKPARDVGEPPAQDP